MTSANHFNVPESGGTGSRPFALFDGPRYAQMVVGKCEGVPERCSFSEHLHR